jgi:hypothetical protein
MATMVVKEAMMAGEAIGIAAVAVVEKTAAQTQFHLPYLQPLPC